MIVLEPPVYIADLRQSLPTLAARMQAELQALFEERYADPRQSLGAAVALADTLVQCATEHGSLGREVFEAIASGIIVHNDQGIPQYANRAACTILGLSLDQLLCRVPYPAEWNLVREDGLPLSGLASPAIIPEQNGEPATSKVVGVWAGEPRSLRWLLMHSIPIVDQATGRQCEIVTTFTDISRLKRAEQDLHQMAHFDALTGLPNRHLLFDRLRQALAHARREEQAVALLTLDLDRFKILNENFGPEVGDRLLRTVAERLVRSLRDGDTIARLEGDQFVVVLPNIKHVQNAARVAQKLQTALAQPLWLEDTRLYLEASIGIALFPMDGPHGEILVKNAETAMYRVKEQGRNSYQFFTPDMHTTAVRRLSLENDLRRALENGEFRLHYQPQVNVYSRRIIGTEALIRWQHPQHGLISPGHFIPVAEETGLIVPIGEWVLRTACAQNKTWQEAGFPPIPVAVNLSARQLRQEDFLALIDRILGQTGLDARYLELELTESCIEHNTEATIAMLRRLRAMGIQISIDDFGTGFSNLSRLKRFPINTLKLDQSFLYDIRRDATGEPDDAVIIRAIVSLAHGLRLKVIAEGVETEEQWAFLRALHCNEFQGYLFSAPVPPHDFERLLRTQEPWQEEPSERR